MLPALVLERFKYKAGQRGYSASFPFEYKTGELRYSASFRRSETWDQVNRSSCSASTTTGRCTRVAPVAAPARRVRFLHAVKVRTRGRLSVRPPFRRFSCVCSVWHFSEASVRCISTALACSLLLYCTCCALMTESGYFWNVADGPIDRASSSYGMVACSIQPQFRR
jgi:hypothetical protein